MSVRSETCEDVAIITVDRPPANALDEKLVEDLRAAFRKAVGARSVLLASSLPSIFSAGWDLPSLLPRDRESMGTFFESFCDLVREIFAFGSPVVAVLSGHAIAGGLIVAAAADERYAAAGAGRLGLSEVLLGVPVPRCCLEVFRHAIGDRATERLAATGENQTVEEAAALGFVDRVFPSDKLFERALDRARLLAERPTEPYASIKGCVRESALSRFDHERLADPFLDFWFGADGRERVGRLVAKLKGN